MWFQYVGLSINLLLCLGALLGKETPAKLKGGYDIYEDGTNEYEDPINLGHIAYFQAEPNKITFTKWMDDNLVE